MPIKKLRELIEDDSGIPSITNQTPAAGSLFGSAQPANASTPKPGSLFGAPAAAANTQPQQNSIFASTASAQPQQTGSLFGAPAQNQTPSQPQTQTQTTGSIFGNANANNTGATNAPSMFGGNAAGTASLGQTAQQRPSLL